MEDRIDRIRGKFGQGKRGWIRRIGARRLLDIPLARYALLGLFAAGIVIAALTLLAAVMVEDWSQRDIDLRSRLVFRSIRDQVAMAMTAKPDVDLGQVFERIIEDERILALGFCTAQGQLRYATKEFPKSVTCDSVKRDKSNTFATVTDSGRRIHISSFPITVSASTGHLLVLHDLAYIDERTSEARLYTLLALVGVTSGLGLLATAIVLALMRAWTRSIRGALAEVRHGAVAETPQRSNFPISREVHAALAELRTERRFAHGIHVEWSPKTLHRLLVEELPDAQVLVVSNREPYIHNRSGHEVTLQIPASGLVAALEPVMRACGGTWVAHGSGSADRDTVDANDRLRVPPADHPYEYLFYNPLVGGLQGASRRYVLDYWFDSMPEAVHELEHYVRLANPAGPSHLPAQTYSVAVCGERLSFEKTVTLLQLRYDFMPRWDQSQFFIAPTHMNCDRDLDGKVVGVVKRLGVAIAYVKDRRALTGRVVATCGKSCQGNRSRYGVTTGRANQSS